LLVRHGGELLALDAAAAMLHGADGSLRTVQGDRESFSVDAGPWWLTGADGRCLALSA
jgi:hypothetical protein